MTEPESTGTLRALAAHLVRAMAPLDLALRDVDEFARLMFELGWEVEGLPPEYVAIADQVLAAGDALAELSDDPTISELLTLIEKAGAVYQAVTSLNSAPPGVDPGAFLLEIGRRLFEYLLARDLLTHAPRWFATLHSLGIITFTDTPPATGRPGYTLLRFDWDQIPAILSDPALIPERLYGWGTPHFAFGRFAAAVTPLLHAVGVPVSLDLIEEDLSDALQSGAVGEPAASVRQAMTLPLFDVTINDKYHEVGFLLAGLPAEGAALPGMILQILAPSGLTEQIDLGGGWAFELRAGTDLAEQLAVIVRPGETLVRYPFAPGHPLPSAGVGLALTHRRDEPVLLFGEPGHTRLELTSGSLSLGVVEKAGEAQLEAGAMVDGLVLVLAPADVDGFLGSALGGDEIRIPVQLGVAWSSRTGLSFLGGAGFAVSLYPHLDLGLLRFDRVDLAVRLVAAPGPPHLDIAALVSFSGAIGPVSYAVEGLGIQLAARFSDGNAGPFDLALDPVWPTGLGLAIDAGPIRGGGFISLDRDRGRYVGILQVEIFDIGLSAIGVLDTRDSTGAPLPAPGFSFILIVAADLPSIQLGYGFTLEAVGGIAALNRRLDTAALLAGIRQGGLQNILFPADPVRDANAIVASLTTVFPVAMGRHVFGPTAIIGWGTPTLITIELAVVVEVPAPIVLTLLGQASVVLPDADAPIVELHVDVVGVLDPARRTLAIDASLHDSQVAGFALSGDFALRLSYGDSPGFALAVGGLNPHFNAPPGFPTLRRASLALGSDNPRISIEGYLAVTSNSRQFGAKAEFYAAAAGFNVYGWLSFDALLVIFPLSFRFDFSVGMALRRGTKRIAGITVHGTLSGPSPFHVRGKGSLSLLFFDISVPFNATFGLSMALPTLAPLDPWGLLREAIELLDNWSGEATAHRSVRLTGDHGAPHLLDPASAATLRQKVLPLRRTLELFGQYEVSGPTTFAVHDVLLGAGSAELTPVTDFFTPGDFERLSATDQISRDSFESMESGVRVGSGVEAPAAKVASIEYQTKIVDSSWQVRTLPPFRLDLIAQLAAVEGGATAQPRPGRSRFARADGRGGGVVLDPETYTVASTDNLSPVVGGMTKGAALQALRRSDAAGAGLVVVPEHEGGARR